MLASAPACIQAWLIEVANSWITAHSSVTFQFRVLSGRTSRRRCTTACRGSRSSCHAGRDPLNGEL